MIFRSRSRLLLAVAALVLVAGAAIPAGGASAASSGATVSTEMTTTKPPWVSRIYMGAGPTTGGDLVKIYGHHFTGVRSVKFGGVHATSFTVLDDAHLTAITPAHAAGRYRVRLDSAAGSSRRASGYAFVVPPAVTSVSPTLGLPAGGATVTLTGSGFTNAAFVRFGGVNGTNLQIVDDSTLTVVAPAHVAADVRVRVVRYNGSSPRSTDARYTYAVAPTISSKTPNHGPPSGGTSVTIAGTHFTGATSVTFDGISASFTVTNDSEIVAISPPHTSGLVAVTIVTPHGTVTDPADMFPWIYD